MIKVRNFEERLISKIYNNVLKQNITDTKIRNNIAIEIFKILKSEGKVFEFDQQLDILVQLDDVDNILKEIW